MRILFLTDNFPPEVNAPASRTYEHCREWVRAGAAVTVVTTAPNFPRGKVFDGHRNRLWSRETVEGIDVIRVWTYIAPNAGMARRILDFVSFAVTGSIAAILTPRTDIVIGTSPQFFTAVAARFVGAVKRVPWIFELRDMWPESIKAVGAMRQGRAIEFLERWEQSLYHGANAIVSVTNSFVETLAQRGIDRGKISVITNGVDLTRFAPQPKDAALLAKYGLAGKFVAGYVGTLGMAHGLDTVLAAAELLQNTAGGEDIRVAFLGDGSQKIELMRAAEERHLRNVVFVDSVPKSEIAAHWSIFDVSLIHLRATPLFETVIPSKLFESMAMGLPIILGVRGEAARILAAAGAGVAIDPENPDVMAAALLELRDDKPRLQQFRDAGIAAAQNYDRRTLAARMLEIVSRVSASAKA